MTNRQADDNCKKDQAEGRLYRIAVVQFAPELARRDANLIKLEFLCKDIRADLIVLPELATSGYVFGSTEELYPVAESFRDGKSRLLFSRLAKQLNATIVYGFPELEEGRIYNSCALLNPDGTFGLYRKAHLFYREKLLFERGNTGLVTCLAKDGVRVGLMICFDWQFPEVARVLALENAQIICHPANLVLPWCQQAMLTRSLENRIFTVTANRIGTESNTDLQMTFTGQSQITNTRGEILLRLSPDKEEIGLAEIAPQQAWEKTVTDLNDAFGDRRPDLYTKITEPKLWKPGSGIFGHAKR